MHLRLLCREGSPLRCEVSTAKNADQRVGTDAKKQESFLVLLQRHLFNTLTQQIKTHFKQHLKVLLSHLLKELHVTVDPTTNDKLVHLSLLSLSLLSLILVLVCILIHGGHPG